MLSSPRNCTHSSIHYLIINHAVVICWFPSQCTSGRGREHILDKTDRQNHNLSLTFCHVAYNEPQCVCKSRQIDLTLLHLVNVHPPRHPPSPAILRCSVLREANDSEHLSNSSYLCHHRCVTVPANTCMWKKSNVLRGKF